MDEETILSINKNKYTIGLTFYSLEDKTAKFRFYEKNKDKVIDFVEELGAKIISETITEYDYVFENEDIKQFLIKW